MKKYIGLLVSTLVIVATVVTMGVLLATRESEVLFRMQELSLFLPTRLFFHTSTIYPGGVLTWLAAYMVQFFYHPALGVALMMLAWAAIMILSIKVFRLKGPWIALATLTPMALLAILTQIGYWIYYMKLQGHEWVPTLGVLFALLLNIPTTLLKAETRRLNFLDYRLAWMLILVCLGYPLMGAWGLLSVAICLVICLRDEGTWKWRITYAAIALILIGLMPHIICNMLYPQVEPDCRYWAALPSYQMGQTNCPEYHYPFYALILALGIMALVHYLPESKSKRPYRESIIALLLITTGAWGVNRSWYRDTNFHKEVAMSNCIERLDWEGVLRVMMDGTMGDPMPPTRAMVMEKNLALFRLGRAGDDMFKYPEGSEQQHASWQVKLTQIAGKTLYYFYGKENFCYRWCMEDGVEYGWNVDVLKYMARTSLINHEWEVARKYLTLLDKTRYYHDWAEERLRMVGHPELMAKDEEMKTIIPMAEFGDHLDGDNTLIELYLLRTFANGHGADPYYQENTLICAMLMKDINVFWPRFQEYINMHHAEPNFHVPTYYQQAAYLYSMLEPDRPSQLWPQLTNAQAAEHMPWDPDVKQKYQDFMTFNAQCGAMTDEQKKVAFYPQFSDTFYYFYFLMRNQKTN